MKSIWMENYRCFRYRQDVRLAPLTLLVGENSTGKTSFLAMVRALWDTVAFNALVEFKEGPYDLGSYDQIAHYRGGRGGRAEAFKAGFSVANSGPDLASGSKTHRYKFTFEPGGTSPITVKGRKKLEDNWIEWTFHPEEHYWLRCRTCRGSWETIVPGSHPLWPPAEPFYFFRDKSPESFRQLTPLDGSPPFGAEDHKLLVETGDEVLPYRRLFASAPVRSKPRRTYDPARPTPEPEGEHIPMYLAEISFWDTKLWQTIKKQLEEFGKGAGLFDAISIRHLGKRNTEPFQMQIKKSGGKLKGPWRNLIDVGYGVSQVLPVITELLRNEETPMFLLQQPEVHLHPSAQAALGSLFCSIASWDRQLIVETHSDHLIDRVRMDVRDRKGTLEPEDVSILFFERDGLEVNIHALGIDEIGNVVGAPGSYRQFFMEETTRSLGL